MSDEDMLFDEDSIRRMESVELARQHRFDVAWVSTWSHDDFTKWRLLTDSQRQFVVHVLHGYNVFLTGPGGSGKSFAFRTAIHFRARLKQFDLQSEIQDMKHSSQSGSSVTKKDAAAARRFKTRLAALKSKKKQLMIKTVRVTAMTGKAAQIVGGSTLHSCIGFPSNVTQDANPRTVAKLAATRRSRLALMDVLFIDEVSMLSSAQLKWMDRILRAVKGYDVPFGGVQIVTCGDFLQLPPVEQRAEYMERLQAWEDSGKPMDRFQTVLWAFQSELWPSIAAKMVVLDVSHRHASDVSFSSLLQRMRLGHVTDDDIALLNARVRESGGESVYAARSCATSEATPSGTTSDQRAMESGSTGEPGDDRSVEPTQLFSHRRNANDYNRQWLLRLDGNVHRFHAIVHHHPIDSGDDLRVAMLQELRMPPSYVAAKSTGTKQTMRGATDPVPTPATASDATSTAAAVTSTHQSFVTSGAHAEACDKETPEIRKMLEEQGYAWTGPALPHEWLHHAIIHGLKPTNANILGIHPFVEVKRGAQVMLTTNCTAEDGSSMFNGMRGVVVGFRHVSPEYLQGTQTPGSSRLIHKYSSHIWTRRKLQEWRASRAKQASDIQHMARELEQYRYNTDRGTTGSAVKRSNAITTQGSASVIPPLPQKAASSKEATDGKRKRTDMRHEVCIPIRFPSVVHLLDQFGAYPACPEVRFANGRSYVVLPQSTTYRVGVDDAIVVWQIPLQLAWAFTVHKAQGSTLDCVAVDPAGTFAAGQAYTAFSRATHLSGLVLLSKVQPSHFIVDKDARAFYMKST